MRLLSLKSFELFHAVREGTADQVIHRLAKGDNPNALDGVGQTPIFYAVGNYLDRDLTKIEVLFKAGALIDVWDHYGQHPLHWRIAN